MKNVGPVTVRRATLRGFYVVMDAAVDAYEKNRINLPVDSAAELDKWIHETRVALEALSRRLAVYRDPDLASLIDNGAGDAVAEYCRAQAERDLPEEAGIEYAFILDLLHAGD